MLRFACTLRTQCIRSSLENLNETTVNQNERNINVLIFHLETKIIIFQNTNINCYYYWNGSLCRRHFVHNCETKIKRKEEIQQAQLKFMDNFLFLFFFGFVSTLENVMPIPAESIADCGFYDD